MRSTEATSPTTVLDAASMLPTPAAVVNLPAADGKEAGVCKGWSSSSASSSSGDQGT